MCKWFRNMRRAVGTWHTAVAEPTTVGKDQPPEDGEYRVRHACIVGGQWPPVLQWVEWRGTPGETRAATQHHMDLHRDGQRLVAYAERARYNAALDTWEEVD